MGQRRGRRHALDVALVVGIGLVIVGVIALANLGLGRSVFALLRYVPGRDLTAHAVFYAALAFALGRCIHRPDRARTWRARIRAGALLSVVIALEEVSQAFLPTRSFTLADLSMSLVGVVAGLWLSMVGVRDGES